MTDQELIRLLQQKLATELTSDEVLSVRSRWTDSAEFRLACSHVPDLVATLTSRHVLAADHDPLETTIDVINSAVVVHGGGMRSRLFLAVVGIVTVMGLIAWSWMSIRIPVADKRSKGTVHDESSVPHKSSDWTADSVREVVELDSPGETQQSPQLAREPQLAGVPQSGSEPTQTGATEPHSIGVSGPWTETLAEGASVWSSASPLWTADFQRSGHNELSESVAKLWLEPVESDSLGLSTELSGKPAHRIVRFQGLGKLRAPWRDDAVLRMTPFDVSDLTLLFWAGKTGVAFRWFPHSEPPLCAACQIVRDDASPRPTRWGLLTTDNGAYARLTQGTFDVRYQDQCLVLARGGQVLMSGPLIVAPSEVYLSGQFRLRGLTMHRSDPLPMQDEISRKRTDEHNAARLPWASVPAETGHIVTQDDGSLSLRVERDAEIAMTSMPIHRVPGLEEAMSSGTLCEICVRILSADEGASFFLGDRDGRPLYQWEFRKNPADEGVVLRSRRGSQSLLPNERDAQHGPKLILAQPVWLKWIVGFGRIHVLISGDGRHWGAIGGDLFSRPVDEIASFGLAGSPSEGAPSIRISHLLGRELSGLTQLVSRELLKQALVPSVDAPADVSLWKQRTIAEQPVGMDSTEWVMANAVAFLSKSPINELGRDVLKVLLEAAIESKLSFAQKFDLLHDVSMLCDTADNSHAMMIARQYADLGRQLSEAGDPVASLKIRQAVLQAPAWAKNPFQPVCDEMQSHEILHAVYRHDWNSAWRLARAASFWTMLPQPDAHSSERGMELSRHAKWAESLVAEYAPQLDDGTANIMPPNLRHPLVLTVNKTAYSARSEIQAALLNSSFEEACRIAIAAMPNDEQCLLPDGSDSAWFVSFGVFQKMALSTSAEFGKAMQDRYQDLGAIRLRTAANENDIDAMNAMVRQFMGTDAGRDASVWLGDRDVASGQFGAAVQHYLDAWENRERMGRDVVAPRLILARVLAGNLTAAEATTELDELTQKSVTLNSESFTAIELKTLIRDLGDRGTQRDLVDCTVKSNRSLPHVSRYVLALRADFDGDTGTDSGRWEFRNNDVIGRQLSVASDAQRFYVNNRFQVTSYSKETAETIWTCGLGNEQADNHLLPFIPMKPLATEHHLFVRRLTKVGPELVCIESEKGDVVWRHRPSLGVVTDPVIWNGKLFAITATKGDDDLVHVSATWFDDATGEIAKSRELLTLREPVERWYTGQLEFNDRLAICTVAGTTACFDWKGEMKWLRRHLLLRGPVDELADDFRVHAPIVNDRHVVVSLPGVREVCSFDLQNGRTIWSRPLADVRGILGASDNRILIDTPKGLVGLSRATGAPVWFVPVDGRLEMFWLSDTRCAVTHRPSDGGPRSGFAITWLNIETGAKLGQSLVQCDQSEELQLGLLFISDGKFLTFVGDSAKNAKRKLYELLPILGAQVVPDH